MVDRCEFATSPNDPEQSKNTYTEPSYLVLPSEIYGESQRERKGDDLCSSYTISVRKNPVSGHLVSEKRQ